MPLTTRIRLDLDATLTSVLDLVTGSVPLDYNKRIDLTSGVGANQADLVFHDTRTLAASANEDLDLAGVLLSPFGSLLTFARIKTLMISAALGNTNNVIITRPATNGVPLFAAAGDAISVRPGGLLLWVAPDATAVAVTAGTGDLINVANSGAGTAVTYDVVIVGASA